MRTHYYFTLENLLFHLRSGDITFNAYRGEIHVELFESPLFSICYMEMSDYLLTDKKEYFQSVPLNEEDGFKYIDYSWFESNIQTIKEMVIDFIVQDLNKVC